jgi:hypothetical protein
MKFPLFCIDDFYENPEAIREYALGLEYEDQTPYDKRSQCLSEINPELFSRFCDKLFSVFYDSPVRYKVYTAFHIHFRKSDDPDSPDNNGLLHKDPNVLMGGVIYLTPNPNPKAGTTVYKSFEKPLEEVITFQNKYNRLIGFDGSRYPHRVTTRYIENDYRLSQVFFIEFMPKNTVFPLERLPKI